MANPFLPKLIEPNNVSAISESGIWENQNITLMKAISEGIEITSKAREKGVSSIPDIWARPLLFQMALFDERHPLHEQILNEWRGLISIIILSRIQNIPITLDSVVLDEQTTFGDAMQRLNPSPKGLEIGKTRSDFDGIYRWDKIFLIKINGKPIGATSPTTLFYTASDYSNQIADFTSMGIEVDDNGLLIEPTDNELKAKVKAWLQWFAVDPDTNTIARIKNLLNLSTQDRTISTYCNRIISLFKDWNDELTSDSIEPDLEVEVNEDEPLINKRDLPLFYDLTMVLKPKREEFKSDLYFAIASDARPRFKYIIINLNAFELSTDPRVVQNLRVSNIKHEVGSWEASGKRIGNISLPDDTIWVKPELYFFTDILLFRETGPILDEANYNSSDKFVLPLRPEFLECFSSNEALLEMNPQFKEIGNDFEFSINIPILFEGKKCFIRVSRVYKDNPTETAEGRIQEISVPPLIELWPDFYDPRWKRYFLFYDNAKKMAFDPIGKNPNAQLEMEGQQLIDDYNMIKEFTAFPDAVSCSYEEQDAGLIFIKRTKPKSGTYWKVGIDFGTSNSNVWVKRGDADAEQLQLTIKSKKLSNSPDDSRIKLYDYFMPPNPPRIPFITVLRVFEGDGNLNYVLRDFAIQFLETTPKPNRRLKTDIKWSGNQNLMQGFFEHLALLVSAEAIKDGADDIEIYVSYPLAFSLFQQSQFKGQWQTVLNKLKVWPGKKVNEKGGPKDYTESACTGKYFELKLNAHTTKPGAITIDVGGGTSDICVWSDGHIKFQSSIILAGNNIANAFRKSEGLCRTIFRDIEANPQDETDEMKMKYVSELRSNIRNDTLSVIDTHFASVLNYYLKRYDLKIIERLPNLVSDPYFNSLLDIIMVEFAAIVYYCGMVILKMRQDQILHPTANALNLFWGGGASAFIKWLDFGNPDSGIIASTLFNEIIQSFEVKSDDPRLTKDPKSETAYGLVVERNKEVDVASGIIIGGESFNTSTGTEIDFHSEIEAAHIKEFQSFGTENGLGTHFNNFIKVLNEIRRKKLGVKPIDISKHSKLPGSIENTLAVIGDQLTSAGDDELGTHIEPIFILEVKELLREMIEQMQ